MRLPPDITLAPQSSSPPKQAQSAELRKHARETCEALDHELSERYQAGQGIKALAANHGMHPRTVRKRLLEAGVELRPNRRLTDDQIQQAQVLYEQEGWTTHRIGTEFAVSHNTIRRHLQNQGVSLRPMGRPPRNS